MLFRICCVCHGEGLLDDLTMELMSRGLYFDRSGEKTSFKCALCQEEVQMGRHAGHAQQCEARLSQGLRDRVVMKTYGH